MKQDEKELCGWFIFCPKQQLLLVKDGDRFHIPYSVEPPVQLPADTPIHAVGQIQGHPAQACALPLEALTEQNTSFFPTDLRASYDVLPLEEYQCAGKSLSNTDMGQEQPFLSGLRHPHHTDGSHHQTMPSLRTGNLSAHLSCRYRFNKER